MRKLRGYIRRITDGLGPPAGSVDVHATVREDGLEIDQTTHETGVLIVDHLVGAGSATKADDDGSFGWKVELNPGLIDQSISPTDPQVEYRWRFPDESSQVGAAYHSDIERLGWAAGGDCLIWNAIFGGNDPSSASWSGDPATTWNVGNGSIVSFGSGGNAGTLVIRPFIAFLGGILFSVEAGDLRVPVGGLPGSPNLTAQERWDILYAVMNTDTTSLLFGKQTIELVEGTPGASIPTPTPSSATVRRMALHAVKMAPGASAYSEAYDLRTWKGQQGVVQQVVQPPITVATSLSSLGGEPSQRISWGQSNIASLLNTDLAADELTIPIGRAYTGQVIWTGEVLSGDLRKELTRLIVKLTSEGRSVDGTVVAGTDFVIQPYTTGHALAFQQHGSPFAYLQTATLVWSLGVIPAYDVSSNVSSASRAWSKLRFRVHFSFNEPPAYSGAEFYVGRQSCVTCLWPVS